MRWFRKPSDASTGTLHFSGHHLTDDSLLLWLDGELSPSESAEVQEHLKACWACRGRGNKLEEQIAELVSYQDTVTSSYPPPPEYGRSVFLARLQTLAEETTRQGAHSRGLRPWLREASHVLHLPQMSQLGWITTAMVLASAAWLAYYVQTPAVVSADEVVSLSTASDFQSWQGTADPIIVQKLHIRRGSQSMTHTVYRDIVGSRSVSQANESGNAQAGLRAAYLRSSLDWNSLLTAESYARLDETQRAGPHTVRRRTRTNVTLTATYSGGLINQADLTVRLPDYHAVEEDIELSDHSQIEVAEVSYNVVPRAAVPAGTFPVVSMADTKPLAIRPVLRLPLLSNSDLLSAEVKADTALHHLGADLGEQVDLRTISGHGVLVEGVVADDERKQQLVAALQSVPHTRVRVLTFAEAAQRTTAAPSSVSAASPVQSVVANPPLLKGQLEARFPDKDQRQAYVHQTLSLVQSASARAWALNRLANRYVAPGTSSLDSEGREQLQALLTDHVTALQEDLSSLQNLLGSILSQSSNTPAANTSLNPLSDVSSSGTAAHMDDWRTRSHRIHSSVEAVHESIVALLTSSQPNDQSDAETLEVNLRTSLTQAKAELQTLDQNLHKTSLK